MKRSDVNPMPQFFDRYINLVEDIDIFEAFEKYSPSIVYKDILMLSALQDKIYAPGKWTVQDILQHVIDTERVMAYRALRFSRNDDTVLAGYEENLFADNTLAAKRTVADLLEELEVVRKSTILLFKNMDDAMVMRSGVANKSQISALALGFVVIGHAVHHMHVIRDRYYTLLD